MDILRAVLSNPGAHVRRREHAESLRAQHSLRSVAWHDGKSLPFLRRLVLAKNADGTTITPQCGSCAAGISPPVASAYNASMSGMR